MPTFPARAAEHLGADPDLVRELIRGPFRDDYWGGRLPESAFWERLGVPVPSDDDRPRILDLQPRIDPARVAGWGEVADIWIISNHRHEWLEPVLRSTGLGDVVDRVVISSIGGHVKPDPAAWAVLLADGTPVDDVLVVDDQARNLEAARSLGITAVPATGDDAWCDAVDRFLAVLGPATR
jgi:putative hydrolase of the HAD superfamily